MREAHVMEVFLMKLLAISVKLFEREDSDPRLLTR